MVRRRMNDLREEIGRQFSLMGRTALKPDDVDRSFI